MRSESVGLSQSRLSEAGTGNVPCTIAIYEKGEPMAEVTAERSKYTLGAMIFHWLIAIMVILNWWLAEQGHGSGAPKWYMQWHFTIGVSILFLTVLRIVWRLIFPRPALNEDYATWEKWVAKTTYATFYILLVALPLGAWLATSMQGTSINFWGIFNLGPLPVGGSKATAHEILDVHGTVAGLMMYLIILHVLAALKHTLWDKDGELFRMLPFGKVTKPAKTPRF